MKVFTLCHKILFIALFVLAVCSFFFLDHVIYQSTCSTLFSNFFKGCSFIIFPPFLLLLSMGVFLVVRFSKKWRFLTFFLFEITMTQFLGVACVRILKIIIGRARPAIYLKKGIAGFYGFQLNSHFHSFPSGHTMGIFALAMSLSLMIPRYSILFFSISLTLSISRATLAKHYLSDIFGTSCIAMIIAGLTHIILETVTNRFVKDALPNNKLNNSA